MNVRETAANSIVGNSLPAAPSGIASVAVTPDGILQLGTSFWGSKALLSAVELGVFSALASGPSNLEALRKRIGLHPRAARDFLDALVALKMLEREGGVYRNSAEADTFLDKAKPSYIGGMLEMANTRLYRFWGSLTNVALIGEAQGVLRSASCRQGTGHGLGRSPSIPLLRRASWNESQVPTTAMRCGTIQKRISVNAWRISSRSMRRFCLLRLCRVSAAP